MDCENRLVLKAFQLCSANLIADTRNIANDRETATVYTAYYQVTCDDIAGGVEPVDACRSFWTACENWVRFKAKSNLAYTAFWDNYGEYGDLKTILIETFCEVRSD